MPEDCKYLFQEKLSFRKQILFLENEKKNHANAQKKQKSCRIPFVSAE